MFKHSRLHIFYSLSKINIPHCKVLNKQNRILNVNGTVITAIRSKFIDGHIIICKMLCEKNYILCIDLSVGITVAVGEIIFCRNNNPAVFVFEFNYLFVFIKIICCTFKVAPEEITSLENPLTEKI